MTKILLASKSPRRTEILTTLGIAHTVAVADMDETPYPGEAPMALVRRLAEGKAKTIAQDERAGYIIGADTIVVFDGDILGKPRDEEDAFRMLRTITGKTHQVMTGVSVVNAATGEVRSEVNVTTVEMTPATDDAIRAYIASGEPMDKAGAYGIQGIGAAFVASIDGDFYGVMGLSVQTLLSLMNAFELDLFKDLRK